jgi:hypothetical protein
LLQIGEEACIVGAGFVWVGVHRRGQADRGANAERDK